MTASRGTERIWTELWLLDLARCDGLTEDAMALLDPRELERASGFASPVQAREYLASRIGLRQVLMDYGCDGRGAFLEGKDGKPSLPGGPCFSLSRTRHAALIAVSNADVGVDLERLRSVSLSEPHIIEAGRRLQKAGGLGGSDLLQVWTAIEAWVKHQGFSMQWFLGNAVAIDTMIDDLESGRVSLTFPPLPAQFRGAVCATGGSVVRCIGPGRFPGLLHWPTQS
jgi:phosphopantetheinyl transferase